MIVGVSALLVDAQRMQLWTGCKNGELTVWSIGKLRSAKMRLAISSHPILIILT